MDVRGGGPGTRDSALLDPVNTVERIDALALSGGSAFGIEAGGGVQAWLAEQGRGFAIRDAVIPIVPGAVVFDLLNGGDKRWGRFAPYRDLGYAAAAAAGDDFALGSAGAGLGATTANLKGGLGSASAITPSGVRVAALAVVNAVGSVTVGDGPWFWAAPFESGGEYGGRGLPPSFTPDMLTMRLKGGPDGNRRRKHHARRRRDRRRAHQTASQTAGDHRANRFRARDLSGACAARWRCRVRRRHRREADRSARWISPNSAWSQPTRWLARSHAASMRPQHFRFPAHCPHGRTGLRDRIFARNGPRSRHAGFLLMERRYVFQV